MYTTIFKDIRMNENGVYSLKLRIDNSFFVKEFDNVFDLLDYCKEKEVKALLLNQGVIVKKWSDD